MSVLQVTTPEEKLLTRLRQLKRDGAKAIYLELFPLRIFVLPDFPETLEHIKKETKGEETNIAALRSTL